MKNRPLVMQIWIVFGTTLILLVVLGMLGPLLLRSTLIPDIYVIIENAQEILLEYGWDQALIRKPTRPSNSLDESSQALRVEHIILSEEGNVISKWRKQDINLELVIQEAMTQEKNTQQYEQKIDDQEIYYVIRKISLEKGEGYLVSYISKQHSGHFFKATLDRMRFILIIALVVSWIPAIWLSRNLTKPLIKLEKYVKGIADRNWCEPVVTDRKDEIGKLTESIEIMRQRLVQQDRAQQDFLQHISHDLKTPVMVIRSYVQAIQDGIFPKGDLMSTIKVVEEESERLEKRIQDLLYLTKRQYLATQSSIGEKIQLEELIESVVDRFRWRKPHIDWELDIIPIEINGNIEQWEAVLENLLDNQLRYAKSKIKITLSKQKKEESEEALIKIWNDGPAIEETVLNKLFQPFYKGEKGKFGLGLSIVQRIVTLYGGKIRVENNLLGVSFYIEISLST